MRITKKSVDLHWTQDGDFQLGVNGDIKKATSERARLAKQMVIKRLQSGKGDWALYPDFGAGIGDFIGLPNNRDTGQRLKSAVTQTLIEGNLVSPLSLTVRVIPTGERKITILVFGHVISAKADIAIQMEYDLRENKLIPRLV